MKLLRALSFGVGMVVLLFAVGAFAQSPKPEVSYADKQKSKKLKTEGAKAYEADRFEAALKAFLEAYALNPEPKLLPPIGQCYDQLTRYSEAVEAYTRFLQEAEPDNPLRPKVEEKLTASKAALAKLNVKRADLTQSKVSGQKALAAGEYDAALRSFQGAYALDPTPDLIFSIAQCYQKLNKREEAAAAYQDFLAKALMDDPQRALAEKQVASLGKASEVGAKRSRAFVFLYLGSASALGLGAAAGASSLLATEQLNELTEVSAFAEINAAEIERLTARRRVLAPASNVLFATALVAGGAGLVLQLTSKKSARRAALAPSSNGVVLVVQR